MDITYKPFIRDIVLSDFSIKSPIIPITGYKPKYIEKTRENIEPNTNLEQTTESVQINTKPNIPTKTVNTTEKKFTSKQEFKNTMLELYTNALIKRGLNPAFAKALVAQDGHESAWGKKPAGKFNFGGIKGKGSVKNTKEFINGKEVSVKDSFRDFNSLEDYVDYKINLLNGKRYRAFSGDVSGFADRVQHGGYATDPNYAKYLNKLIQSSKNGGIIKAQDGAIVEGKEWVKNWYKNRRDQIKNNIQQTQRIPIPVTGTLGYNILTKNMDLTKASIDPSKLPIDADGMHIPWERQIYLRDNNLSASVHEWVHSSRPSAQINKITKIMQTLGDNIYDQRYTFPDEYWDKPSEIYSRLMQLRHSLGVSPQHKFTTEEIDKLKRNLIDTQSLLNWENGTFEHTTFDKNNKVIKTTPYIPSGKTEGAKSRRDYKEEESFNILNRYSTDFIKQMLNDVASTNKPSKLRA